MNPGNMRQAHVYCRWCKQEKTIIIMVFVARCRGVCNLVRESRCVPFFTWVRLHFFRRCALLCGCFLALPSSRDLFYARLPENLIQFL